MCVHIMMCAYTCMCAHTHILSLLHMKSFKKNQSITLSCTLFFNAHKCIYFCRNDERYSFIDSFLYSPFLLLYPVLETLTTVYSLLSNQKDSFVYYLLCFPFLLSVTVLETLTIAFIASVRQWRCVYSLLSVFCSFKKIVYCFRIAYNSIYCWRDDTGDLCIHYVLFFLFLDYFRNAHNRIYCCRHDKGGLTPIERGGETVTDNREGGRGGWRETHRLCHKHSHTYSHTHTHTHMHARTHTHIHTQTYTYTHIHMHIRI